MRTLLYVAISSLSLVGCSSNYHSNNVHSAHEREMTLGIVQKDIRQGMNQGEVATLLGSPNIVTKDQNGADTWIYDKIASEVSYSKSEGSLGGFGGAVGGIWAIIVGGQASRGAGASAQTQKTLTVVIKFDDNQSVEKVSYHSSKF